MTHYEIVKKLIGKISPVGESNADAERLENVKAYCELVEMLINDLKEASTHRTRTEYSMRKIGLCANNFLEMLKGELNER